MKIFTREQLMSLSEQDLEAIIWRTKWERSRHKEQIVPDGEWFIYLFMAGRGSGKSRTIFEEIAWQSWMNPDTRSLVSAPTAGDLRDVVFEGDSGLRKIIPPTLIKEYNRSLNEIVLQNNTLIKGIPASEPDRFRGPQWHRAGLDEVGAWQYDQEAFDMIVFSVRLGQRPRIYIATTPKPRPLIRNLVKRDGKDVVLRRASTHINLANLAPTFKDQILKYEGTRVGDQEVMGILLDPEEQGIIKRSSIRLWPADKPLPWFDYIIMSLDTAFTEATRDKETGDPDPTGCEVWGLFQYERRANAMLLDAWDARLGFPDLIKRVKEEMQAEYGIMENPILKPLIGPALTQVAVKKIDLLLIEDKGSGISLRQQLASQGINAYAYNPGRADKLTRLHNVSHLFAGGVVWVVESDRNKGQPRTWAQGHIEQWCTFSGTGSIPHDEGVDCCSQALRVLSDRNMLDTIRPPVEQRAGNVGAMKKQVQNPYAV